MKHLNKIRETDEGKLKEQDWPKIMQRYVDNLERLTAGARGPIVLLHTVGFSKTRAFVWYGQISWKYFYILGAASTWCKDEYYITCF